MSELRLPVYFDTQDLGNLACGQYEIDSNEDAVDELVDILRDQNRNLLLSPVLLSEVDAAPSVVVEKFWDLLESVPWQVTLQAPEALYYQEFVAAIGYACGKRSHRMRQLNTKKTSVGSLKQTVEDMRPKFEAMRESNRQFSVARALGKSARQLSPKEIWSNQATSSVEEPDDEEWHEAIQKISQHLDNPEAFLEQTLPDGWNQKMKETLEVSLDDVVKSQEANLVQTWRKLAISLRELGLQGFPADLPDEYAQRGLAGFLSFFLETFSREQFSKLMTELSQGRTDQSSQKMDDIHSNLYLTRVANQYQSQLCKAYSLDKADYRSLVRELEPEIIPTFTCINAVRSHQLRGMSQRIPEKGDIPDVRHLAYFPFVAVMTADGRTVEGLKRSADYPRLETEKVMRGGNRNYFNQVLARLEELVADESMQP